MSGTSVVPVTHIVRRILVVRGQKVMIDADLAELYGVQTKRLNEQVRRNHERFPDDFMFQLTQAEKDEVVANCDHLAKLKFAAALPLAFTEHGALMVSAILNTPRAVELSVYVVRAFVQLREVLATHKDLATKLATLERQMQTLALKHDSLAQNTRLQLKQVFEAIHELMAPPEPPKKRRIGFVRDDDK